MFNKIAHSLGLDDFDKRHKVAFVLLICAMVAVVALWVVQLRRNITDPLYAGLSNGNTPAATQSDLEQELRGKDTDSDGLSDWDELYVYATSPYLADTDGDGTNDSDEVKAGTDPLCPEGQICASSDIAPQEPSAFSNPALLGLTELNPPTTATALPESNNPGTGADLSAEEKEALRQVFGDITDPAALRQMLLQAGMSQSALDALSDEEILETFRELIE